MGKGKPITYTINENGCHIINSHALDKDGYGRIYRHGKQMQAHRYMYEYTYGVIQEGLVVRHKCDTPSCINPKHLELGTHQDNVNDRTERNRGVKGERVTISKLTEDEVKEILLNTTHSDAELAVMYGVDNTAIHSINNGRTWKHVFEKLEDQITRNIILNTRIGEDSGRSKLTEKEVEEILLDNKSSSKYLAQKYNVYPSTINRIKRGDNWKHMYNKIKLKEEN